MAAGNGRVYRPKVKRADGRVEQTAVWWLDYTVAGKRHRESADTTSRKEALDLLHQQVGDRRAGKLVGSPDKVTVGDLQALAEQKYDLHGLRSKDRLKQLWAHLVAFLGADTPAMEVTEARLDAYAVARLTTVSRQTVNNELSALRSGFRLAVEKKRLAVMPVFKLPKVQNARAGFFEEGEFAALLLELPPAVRDLVRFLRATGWRRDEGRLLQWASVDMDGGVIRLEQARSKSGEPRVFPFGVAPDLKALLDARWEARQGLYVFHRDGEPLTKGAVRAAWRRATKRAGLVGRLVHDLRRTAARDFRRAGVTEGVIMQLCGWRTRSMFDRYNIIDEADLAAAVAKRFHGKHSANIAEVPQDATELAR